VIEQCQRPGCVTEGRACVVPLFVLTEGIHGTRQAPRAPSPLIPKSPAFYVPPLNGRGIGLLLLSSSVDCYCTLFQRPADQNPTVTWVAREIFRDLDVDNDFAGIPRRGCMHEM